MKVNTLSRWIYLFIFLLLILLACIVGNFYPKLIEGPVNTLGFLGFWATSYGIVIAIFEIVRTGSIAAQMSCVAEDAHNRLKRKVEYGEMQACLEIINLALHDLQSKKAVPVILISRIKQVYISHFSKERLSKNYSDNLNLLNSYEHIATTRGSKKVQANPDYSVGDEVSEPSLNNDHPYKLTIDTLKRMHDEISTHFASKNYTLGD